MSSPTFNLVDFEIIDIGGSNITNTFDDQLPLAFAHKGPFPKEVAYTAGMEKWNNIAETSYQTADEIEIIKATAARVVAKLHSGCKIIDLGAANSSKYEEYVVQFLAQGKTCTYVALDLNRESLFAQLKRAKRNFPSITCMGLWGCFQDGDRFFSQIPDGKLFLSLGSIFYNAPDDMCIDRCHEFEGHLSPIDALIVGQDGPSQSESEKSHELYQTEVYDAFFTRYLEGIQELAGIVADAKEAWDVTSKMDKTMHFFEVVANHEMVCIKLGGFVVAAGTIYTMFPSWKRGEEEINEITTQLDLSIATLAKAANSGMRQYLIRKATEEELVKRKLAAKELEIKRKLAAKELEIKKELAVKELAAKKVAEKK